MSSFMAYQLKAEDSERWKMNGGGEKMSKKKKEEKKTVNMN